MQQRYEDEPVTIVGASEIDRHFVTADREVVRIGDQPEEVFGLMSEYISAKEITWPIVFCDSRAKSEFGVRGFPSIVLIDRNGIVRHTGLHPASDEELRVKIEALLAEGAND